MILRKVVIQGEGFKNDVIRFEPDNRFVPRAFISSSIDPDLLGSIKEYDTGVKVLVYPTPRVEDTGPQKYGIKATRQVVKASIFYRKVDTEFKEL